MENPKVKAISFGQMDKNMRGCGIRGSGTGQGRGLARKEIHIAENGRKEILTVMEFIQIKLEIYMKDNLNSAWNMGKVLRNLWTDTCTEGIMRTANLQAKVLIIGKMVVILRASFWMAWEMGKEYGSEARAIPINMKENIKMIRNGVMGNSNGQAAIPIKEITRQIFDMATERCTG